MPDSVATAIYLVIILSVLVVAHEWGHFLAARLFRMRVEEFSLFFGPKLLRLGKRGDTEYNVRALPIGGFVRIAGMEPDDISGGRPILEAIRNPRFVEAGGVDDLVRQLDTDTMADIDPARVSTGIRELVHRALGPDGRLTDEGKADLEAKSHSPQITQDEHKLMQMALAAHARATDTGLYSQKPVWQRALVIFAGPFMSLLFGYLVFCAMGLTLGLPSDTNRTNMVQVIPGKPAYRAGMHSGDRIVAVNGAPTPDGKALTQIIHRSIGVPLTLTVDRKGQLLTLKATPAGEDMAKFVDDKPVLVKGKPVLEKQGVIGVVPVPKWEHAGLAQSVVYGTQQTLGNALMLLSIFRQPKELKENVGGPIAIAQMTNVMQRLGFAPLVMMVATLSVTLGIINLFPIPILDGGHLMLLAVEKIRRRRLSPREIYRAQWVGLSVLAMIMVFVFYNDIVRTVTGKAMH